MGLFPLFLNFSSTLLVLVPSHIFLLCLLNSEYIGICHRTIEKNQ